MAATPEGPEYACLPWCPLDPVHPDELVRKSYVDAAAGAGSIGNIPGLQAALDALYAQYTSLAAALAGKMPLAPTDGRQYTGAGSGWTAVDAGGGGGSGGGTWTQPDYAHAVKNNFVSPNYVQNGFSFTYTATAMGYVSLNVNVAGLRDGDPANNIKVNGAVYTGSYFVRSYDDMLNMTNMGLNLLPVRPGDVISVSNVCTMGLVDDSGKYFDGARLIFYPTM